MFMAVFISPVHLQETLILTWGLQSLNSVSEEDLIFFSCALTITALLTGYGDWGALRTRSQRRNWHLIPKVIFTLEDIFQVVRISILRQRNLIWFQSELQI